MNKQSSPLFFSLSLEEKTNNNIETEDSFAAGFNPPLQKIFTAVDMWNIQRQRRVMVQRRFVL